MQRLTWPAVGTAARRLWPAKALLMTADAIVESFAAQVYAAEKAWVKGCVEDKVRLRKGSYPADLISLRHATRARLIGAFRSLIGASFRDG